MDGISSGLNGLLIMAILGVCLFFLGIGYGLFRAYDYYFCETVIESNHIITPTYKLTIENNKVDTLYVYKFKK